MKSSECIVIFEQSIIDYHQTNGFDIQMNNPYKVATIEHFLYLKNWIDTTQWHLEDDIRDTSIDPKLGMEIKRSIDSSNQARTAIVEKIDDYYVSLYQKVKLQPNVPLNTESPAWVVDRLSILCLKIYHMQEQVDRKDIDVDHLETCKAKLTTLLEQKKDLCNSFDQLLEAYAAGTKKIKVYRQMKMYNDETLNPVLYAKKED